MVLNNIEAILADKLYKIMAEAWPYSKEKMLQLRVHYNQEGKQILSRRSHNEIRDALDHLYRIASVDTAEEQIANCNSIHEHIRRATVESLEFHVEETLLEIRPLPLPHNWHNLIKTIHRLWPEYIKKIIIIQTTHTQLMLNRIIEGKNYLVEARRAKGGDINSTVQNLDLALNAFEQVANESKNNSFNILFKILIKILILGIGIGLGALLKL